MRKSYVTIYDLQMRKVAYLENATGIQYETPMNALWTASFSLPANDPKNSECQPLYFAEIFDESERLELFRILPSTLRKGSGGGIITYQCEHVLGTLLDDILFQYHTVGNLGYYTPQVVQYILQRQSVQRWKLGTIQFNHQFEYNWENENLLGALFSVPKPFVDEYMWTWDTTTYPWTLNLVRPSSDVQAYIRYGVNLQGIEKTVDPSNVVTRIFGLGYGEGVNQLTFADINGGKPYLDAEPEYIKKYGMMHTVFVDRRFEYPETLKARCQALLDELKQPRMTYVVQASELYALTKDPIDKFRTGTMVRVQDKEIDEDVTFRVLNVRKQDVIGAPGNVEIEIANRPQDIAGSIADLRNRQYANEVYAQGATNHNSHDFADNCDPQHPAILKFFIPDETVRINKVMLSYQSEPFRAYSKAIEGGGGIATSTAAGGESTQTSSNGGGSTQTSSEGGGISKSTAAGGRTTQTSGPSSTQTSAPAGYANLETHAGGDVWIGNSTPHPGNKVMEPSGVHDHGITPGTKLMGFDGNPITWSYGGHHYHDLRQHTHFYSTIDHVHNMDHTHQVSIPDHTHDFSVPNHSHTVKIPDHTHTVHLPSHKHEITLPNHTHGIQYGIFQGPTPKAVEVRVDGKIVTGLGINETEVDIIPYLAKDGGGKVRRGWHTIEIRPDDLGRIVASVFTQIFVQSRGGGNY